MTLRNWLKCNTRKCCANVLTEDDVITLRRGSFPSSWLDMEVEDEIDEGDFIDLWLR